MSKEELLQYSGVIIERIRGLDFSVKMLDGPSEGRVIRAKAGGKMRRVGIVPTDTVKVAFSSYDLNVGIIVSRD